MRGKLVLGLVVSAGFLVLAFWNVSLREMGQAFREVRLWWLVPATLTLFVRFWLTAIRWRILLLPTKRVGLHRLFSVTMIGFMANNVLPARIGEFVKAYALGKTEQLSKSLSFATIVIERLFDGFTMVLFLLLSILWSPVPPLIKQATIASFALYVVVLGGMAGLHHRPQVATRWAVGGLRLLPERMRGGALRLLDSFTQGLGVLGKGGQVLLVAVASLLIWSVVTAGAYLTFLAFDLSLPPVAALVLVAFLAIGVTLPSSPGYVGPFQYFSVLALGLYGVGESRALAFSFVYHAIQFIPITVVGLIYLWVENLSLHEIHAPYGERL